MQQFLALFALPCLLRLSAARAVWIPEELKKDAAFWVAEDFVPLARRDDQCGGEANFDPCGDSFPGDFCCPTGAQCLSLNTTSSIRATLCCPAGQDCQMINPVACDIGKQNATAVPTSQLHSDPPTKLEQCGEACCPMGFRCEGSACVAMTAEEAADSPTTSATSLLPMAPTGTSSPSGTSESTDGVTTTPIAVNQPAETSEPEPASDSFNGKSFAAGFVPGMAIGAFIAAGIIILMLRRERRKSGSYYNEKHHSSGRDTLTDLSTDLHRRPTVHGRSISEPTADMSLGHRTDFLQYTPPQAMRDTTGGIQGYVVNVRSPPVTPGDQGNGRTWLSRSPFMTTAQTPVPTHSPVPAHLKRGTLSFTVSPIRALRKQKSMHSLRRQRTDLSNRSNSSSRRNRPDASRTGSTETIKVLMDTPATQYKAPSSSTLPSSTYQPQRPQPPPSAATWETVNSNGSSSPGSTPIEEEPNTYTPTRPGRNSNINQVGASLSSPYTPSNYPPPPTTKKHPDLPKIPLSSLLAPERNAQSSRDSTFSALMEKVGLRKTMLMGPDSREWNKR